MNDGFHIKYTGHELRARKLLLKKGLKTAEELAVTASFEVEQAINAVFKAIDCGEDWLLVPLDKVADFNELITWIDR